jgi:ribonucleoside-triphosphate reductase
MYLKQSYDQEFTELMLHLKEKYPAKLFDLEGIGKQLDMCSFSKDFFSASTTADASIDANANVSDMSNIAYGVELPKAYFKLNSYYMLWKQLKKTYGRADANNIVEKQLIGDIYINDFHGIAAGSPYCFNYSTYDIMLQGLNMIDKITCAPPKYLFSFKSQLEQFVVVASNSTLGATGLADLLIVMSLYVRRILRTNSDANFKFADEQSCWSYVKETMVSLIFTLNQNMRGNQSPFTNLSLLDRHFLAELTPGYIDPVTGEAADAELVQKLQELFVCVMQEEMRRTPITFPITTACFVIDEEGTVLDDDFVNFVADKNREFGFINIFSGKSSVLSSCCRLRSDNDNEYFNSFGAGSTKIGSLGVCTINLPRLAVRYATDESGFMEALGSLVGTVAKINHAKRQIVSARIANGNLPLYTLGYMSLDRQYSTVGVNGLNECCELLGHDILSDAGQAFVLDLLRITNEKNDLYQKRYKSPHNVEQIPGETSSIRLARKDSLLGYNPNDYPLYSNQFIPLTTKADMLDRIRLQGLFDRHFSGGAICHLNIEQRIEDPQDLADLIRFCAKQGVVYWAPNYNLQRCEAGHMSVGTGETCVICGGLVTDNFTRVVGFLTNVRHWHEVRREHDAPNRQFYAGVRQ